MKKKIFDCVTFFQENLQMELRFNILNDVVDKFVVCESVYDHRGKEKKINFSKYKYPEVISKIEHIIITKKFPEKNTPWQNQSWQREYILEGIKDADKNDLIMFSDPDEIPNPEKLKNFNPRKKYSIFLQNMYTYRLNIFNKYESPWEGTRICKKKDLSSVDWLRDKVLAKNLKYPFWRIDKEKNIDLIEDGGWHFNYLLKPEQISKKLKSLAAIQWDWGEKLTKEEFFSINNIEEKISSKKDLFNRGHNYQKITIDESFPQFIRDNLDKYKNWLI
jgi:beta-1,4-mannosyl-glycoprotein beta-1,4-N-acetylglucosaminyltransferase